MSNNYYSKRALLFNHIHNSDNELIICQGDRYNKESYNIDNNSNKYINNNHIVHLTCERGYNSYNNYSSTKWGNINHKYHKLRMTVPSMMSDKMIANIITHMVKNQETYPMCDNTVSITIHDNLPSIIHDQKIINNSN